MVRETVRCFLYFSRHKSFHLGVGVPIMLAYVYGVVPLSLCRNGSCGVTASSSGVRLDVDADLLAMAGTKFRQFSDGTRECLS